MEGTWWYRVVAKNRSARQEVLESKWGRFHDDPETEPTMYLADSLLTAWREVAARLGEIPADPWAFRAWRVTVSGVNLADLTNPEEQSRHQVTGAQLLADPPPLRLKVVARKLRQQEAGYHGLIYESVRNRPDGVCMVLFLEHAGEVIEIEPIDEKWAQFVVGAGL